jgi:predicted Zn-ribbon and HTH transcriptional regulator
LPKPQNKWERRQQKNQKVKIKLKNKRRKMIQKTMIHPATVKKVFFNFFISQEIQNLKICKHVESIETQNNLKIPEKCPFCKPNQVIAN